MGNERSIPLYGTPRSVKLEPPAPPLMTARASTSDLERAFSRSLRLLLGTEPPPQDRKGEQWDILRARDDGKVATAINDEDSSGLAQRLIELDLIPQPEACLEQLFGSTSPDLGRVTTFLYAVVVANGGAIANVLVQSEAVVVLYVFEAVSALTSAVAVAEADGRHAKGTGNLQIDRWLEVVYDRSLAVSKNPDMALAVRNLYATELLDKILQRPVN